MVTILVILLIIALACTAVLFWRDQQRERKTGHLRTLDKKLELARDELDNSRRIRDDLLMEAEGIRGQISTLHHEEEVAKVKRNTAVELAEKDFELEAEKRRADFEVKLNAEFEELREKHPLTASQRLLDSLNLKIDEARKTLKVQQEQAQAQLEKEDFVAAHTIGLSEYDQGDIELIRGFAPKLTRKDAFYKLIWTEFYQKPLQALCKVLNADKVTGIYKITNTGNGRMYIGQAVDIGTRWKEHVKCGLGIGTTSYMSNKFYKALHDDGAENFTFEVLELCDRADLNARERYWIDFYNSSSFGYNTKIGG